MSSQAFLTTSTPEWYESPNSNGTHQLWGSYYTLLAVFIYTHCALLILHNVQSYIFLVFKEEFTIQIALNI